MPGLTFNIPENGIGGTNVGTSVPLLIGTGTSVPVNELRYVGNPEQAKAFGLGPLPEAAAHVSNYTGGCYIMGLPGSVDVAPSAVTQVGGGPLITLDAASDIDAFLRVEVVTGGAVGTAEFVYSLDANPLVGTQFSNSQRHTVQAGPFSLVVAGIDSGTDITFPVGTYEAGTVYTARINSRYYSAADVVAAFDALSTLPVAYDYVGLLGAPGDATTAISVATTLDTQMIRMLNLAHPLQVVMNLGADTPANIRLAMDGFSSTNGRVFVAYSDVGNVNQAVINDSSYQLATMDPVSNVIQRAASVPFNENLALRKRGALAGCRAAGNNERFNPTDLRNSRVMTFTSKLSSNSAIILEWDPSTAVEGSDHNSWHRGRIRDVAYKALRDWGENNIGEQYAVERITIDVGGTPLEIDAISASVAQRLSEEGRNALVPVMGTTVSDLRVRVLRDNDFLKDSTICYEVLMLPKGDAEYIKFNLSFANGSAFLTE